MKSKKFAGFTLIELIIVIAIIALLAAATFVAVDPAKRIGDAQNAQRWSDVTAIADAFTKYTVDNNGTLATTTDETGSSGPTNGVTYAIASSTLALSHSSTYCINTTTAAAIVLDNLVSSGYLGNFPVDPTHAYGTEAGHVQYYFYTDANGIIVIGACETYEASGAANYVVEVSR